MDAHSRKVRVKNVSKSNVTLPVPLTSVSQMTYYCCVLGCNSNSENSPNVKFHALPVPQLVGKSTDMGEEKMQFLSKQLKICDAHYKQYCELNNLNSDPNSSFTMNIVMPSVNTKGHAAGFHDDSFILGPADIPVAGVTTEVVEEEIITDDCQTEGVKYILADDVEYVEVKTEDCFDIDSVCRVCLTNEDLKHIETEYYDNVLIYEMLQSCVKVSPREEEKLPKRICLSCIADLKVMYDFVKRFEKSKNTLESYITKEQDINERRFYLEHGYVNQGMNMSGESMEISENTPSTSRAFKPATDEEIRISNSVKSLSKELVRMNDKSNIELDGKTYVLAKAFLCKTCNELIFVQESLDEHKCDTAKKKSQSAKNSNNNLLIRQTDINRCKNCGKKFTNLARHKCVLNPNNSAAGTLNDKELQKCPKCKLKFKFFHQCEADTHSSKKMPIVIK